MIEWREIEYLPTDLVAGRSFLFCTLDKRIFHVTLVLRGGATACWSTGGAGAGAALLSDRDMALVTHFAAPNLPDADERQIAAVAVRVANLDGRSFAYEHDRYGR
ncbi:hypothetical protein [Sphingobium chungangianum]